jgi:hypothetical protein
LAFDAPPPKDSSPALYVNKKEKKKEKKKKEEVIKRIHCYILTSKSKLEYSLTLLEYIHHNLKKSMNRKPSLFEYYLYITNRLLLVQ